jgi:hypothetical protein
MPNRATIIVSAAIIATGLGAIAAAITTTNGTITKADLMTPHCRQLATWMAAEKADIEREHRSHVWTSDSDKFFKAGSQWLEEQCGWDSLLGWLKPSGLYSPQPAPPANRMGGI